MGPFEIRRLVKCGWRERITGINKDKYHMFSLIYRIYLNIIIWVYTICTACRKHTI